MNKPLLSCVLQMLMLGCLLLGLSGCQTTPESAAQDAVASTNPQDEIYTIGSQMVQNMLQNSQVKAKLSNRETLLVSRIKNETNDYVDVKLLTEIILKELLKADVRYTFRLTTDAQAPKLHLEGSMASLVQKDAESDVLRTVQILKLTLTDKASNTVYWSDERKIKPGQ